MGLIRHMLFSIIFILFMYSTLAEAVWQDPQILLSGDWGNQPDQFGIDYGDSGDTFPRDIIVLANGDIWIPDGLVNERLKLYDSTGNLKKIISLDKATLTFSEYWFIGKLEAVGSNRTVYTSHYTGDNLYAQFSPTGQLLQTYTEKPLELGVVTEKKIALGQYKVTVSYPDKVWGIIGKGAFPKYMRDLMGNLYASGEMQVARFNECGKEITRLTMPAANHEEISYGPDMEPINNLIEEYGAPVLAPNGDVYTWKRTPDKYSIIKWIWQDDPNPPANLPDAPLDLKIEPSPTSLALSWKASLQDPGCVAGYEVVRSVTAGEGYTAIGTVDKRILQYEDATAEAGTTYYYKVRAGGGDGYSDYTVEASGVRPISQ